MWTNKSSTSSKSSSARDCTARVMLSLHPTRRHAKESELLTLEKKSRPRSCQARSWNADWAGGYA